MTMTADFDLKGTNIGDSIAVNGACLTAVQISGNRFEIDASPETLGTTNLSEVRPGERVNLERAMRLSDRLDGHLVSGHIDGIGSIAERKTTGNAVVLTFKVPKSLARYLIRKGSVAVDGISLTVNDRGADWFSVSVIPYTALLTTIRFKPVGAPVNIETDIIGKYVERFLLFGKNPAGQEDPSDKGIDLRFLARHGFL